MTPSEERASRAQADLLMAVRSFGRKGVNDDQILRLAEEYATAKAALEGPSGPARVPFGPKKGKQLVELKVPELRSLQALLNEQLDNPHAGRWHASNRDLIREIEKEIDRR